MKRSLFAFLPCLLLCLASVIAGCGGSNSTAPEIIDTNQGIQIETIRQDNSRAFRISWNGSGYPEYTTLEYHIYRSTKFEKYLPHVGISELVGVVPAGVNSFVDTKDARTLTFLTMTGPNGERTLETKTMTAQGVKQDDTPYYYAVTVFFQDDSQVPIFGRNNEFWVGGYGSPFYPPSWNGRVMDL